MIIQIDHFGNDESPEDTQLEMWNAGDSLELGIRYDWDNKNAKYKNAEWIVFQGTNLQEFFNSVRALEETMKVEIQKESKR